MATALDTLRAFAAARDKRRGHGALSEIGLIVGDEEQEFLRCDETPANGHLFAHTGGDGVHFCLLEDEETGSLTDRSPVVMVVPCNAGTPRLVLGDTLHEFLGLGSVTGFFFLEQLTYDRPTTLAYLFDYEAFLRHCYFGPGAIAEYAEDLARHRELLRDLTETFALRPWPHPGERLAELQGKWVPRIRLER